MKKMKIGDEMSEEQLEKLRRMIEEMKSIDKIDPGLLEIIAARWPWLLSKIKPQRPR